MPLVIRTPMGGGRGYGPTHSQSIERLFFGIPHLKLVAASHAHDAGALLHQAVADPEPVLFVENKLLYPLPLLLPAASSDSGARCLAPFAPCRLSRGANSRRLWLSRRDPGQLSLRARAPDVTLIAYGGMSRLLAPVLERLPDEEIRVLACLPSCISPLDMAPLVAAAAAESGRVLVVEESQAAFGWGAEVAAAVYERLGALVGDGLLAPVRRLGIAPTVIPAARALEDQVLIGETQLEAAILELLRKQTP